ncbi:MAG: hypothetical protein JWR80_2234 [Bradyrhizobium sp.]|nr:hypothetical protein [Bradyrhizobium sp.]
MTWTHTKRWGPAAVAAMLTVAAYAAAHTGGFPKPLPVDEATGSVVLPSPIPAGWVFVHDLNPGSILDGRVVLIDPDDARRPLKGQVRSAQFGSFRPALAAGRLYTSETFYSRLTRGERTDVLTIWDARTLEPTGEVVLPPRRGQILTQPGSLALTDKGRIALVWNFTPASSVSVVDLKTPRLLGEIETTGCSLIYPTGDLGFYSLCGDGGLVSIQLDHDGQEIGKQATPAFNRIDNDPLFMIPVNIGGIDYFASFRGRLQPIDARGPSARVLAAWSLVTPNEARSGWRPSGGQLLARDRRGQLYVIMQTHGHEGSHKSGGREIWVFDVGRKQRLKRIVLKRAASGIAITGGATPRLLVSTESGMDVYDQQGVFRHSLPTNLSNLTTIIWSGQ